MCVQVSIGGGQPDESIINNTHLTSGSRTALVFDEDMTLHKNSHDRTHLERPERILQPMRLLEESRLLSRVRTVTSREVSRDEVI